MRGVIVAAVVAAGLLTACAPVVAPRLSPDVGMPAGFPEPLYRAAIDAREPVFRVDSADSLVVIEVRRGGSLARLGHDHVVASHDLRGYVAPGLRRSDLYVPLERLAVDEPALRSDAGFDSEPSAADVAGTRRNMLQKVLEVDRYPFALVSVTAVDGDAARLNVSIALHGVARVFRIPVQVSATDDALQASGSLAFDQTDFGIVPFSILGGAVQVQNRVTLRFSVHARRVGA